MGELVARLATGDQSALGTLYGATSRLVYGLALRIVQVPADADEVTLDVYSQAWRQADRYDPERADVVGWLLAITRSRAIGRIRVRGAMGPRQRPLEEVSEQLMAGDDPRRPPSSRNARAGCAKQWLRSRPSSGPSSNLLTSKDCLTRRSPKERACRWGRPNQESGQRWRACAIHLSAFSQEGSHEEATV